MNLPNKKLSIAIGLALGGLVAFGAWVGWRLWCLNEGTHHIKAALAAAQAKDVRRQRAELQSALQLAGSEPLLERSVPNLLRSLAYTYLDEGKFEEAKPVIDSAANFEERHERCSLPVRF